MSKLFAPDIPEQEDPAPLPDEATASKARRRRITALRTRRGRASTALTGDGGKGFGTEFSRTLLG